MQRDFFLSPPNSASSATQPASDNTAGALLVTMLNALQCYRAYGNAVVVLHGLLQVTSETLQCCSSCLDKRRHFGGAVLR